MSDPVHDVLDARPAEIAHGVYLPSTKVRAEARVSGLKVTLVVEIKDRQPCCAQLTVESVHQRAPVTGTTLREIPLAAIMDHVISGVFGTPFRFEGPKRVPISTQQSIDARSDRMPRRVLMPKVVDAYREAMANPATRAKPILTVAEQLGGYQPAYISKLVSEARREGLLGRARPGIAGEQ
jgi:hypothetical protein